MCVTCPYVRVEESERCELIFEGLLLVRVPSDVGRVGTLPAVREGQGRSGGAGAGWREEGRLGWLLRASFSFARHRGYPEAS